MIGETPAERSDIPSFAIIGEALEVRDAMSLWLETVHLLFDAEPLRPTDQGFDVSLRAFKLGPMLFGRARAQGQRFVRDAKVIARGGADWLLVQLYVQGGYRGVTSRGPITVRPGDISVLDLAETLSTEAEDFDNINIILPREMLASRLASGASLQGRVLRRELGCTRILQRHMHAMDELVAELDAIQSAALIESTLALLASALSQILPGGEAPGRGPDGLVMAIRQHIHASLGDPDLGADSIAAHFGMSRATLYRLVRPLGGVSEYIRQSRLRRACAELQTMNGVAGRVSVIARRWGFGSEATFTRLFKATYGCCPSQARASVAGPGQQGENGNPIVSWMRGGNSPL